MRRAAISLPLLAAATSCGLLTDPRLPAGAEPFAPPPVYATWWAMTEACAGVSRPFSSVRWYRVAGADEVRTPDGRPAGGYWESSTGRVVLAGTRVLWGGTVRHEMLHALLRRRGHPRDAFLGRCGGVVVCAENCVADAGPPPAPAAATARVAPAALEVRVAVAPAAPSAARDGGFFVLVVSARNPAAHPVVVVPPPGGGGAAPGYQFVAWGPAGGLQGGIGSLDPGHVQFGPGETKRQVFDFVLGPRMGEGYPDATTLPPGRYRIEGRFGGQSAVLEPVELTP
jgi:hypothetical protein